MWCFSQTKFIVDLPSLISIVAQVWHMFTRNDMIYLIGVIYYRFYGTKKIIAWE